MYLRLHRMTFITSDFGNKTKIVKKFWIGSHRLTTALNRVTSSGDDNPELANGS